VTIDDDNIMMRGCLQKAPSGDSTAPPMLVWTRSDLMMAGLMAADRNAPNAVGTTGMAGRVFYWLDDDEDLSKHVGRMVEIKGELEDFEKGEIEVKRDGEFTEIQLDLGGKKEKARVPATWLGPSSPKREQEFEIVARRIDVKNVRVIGACDLR
jgi:hypothetical protein